MDNILITGAASGIGAATARLFHARGWKVGLLDINHAALASLAEELGGVWHAELDVADAAAVQAALKDFAGEHAGQLRLLFNCAGVLRFGHFESIELAEHARILQSAHDTANAGAFCVVIEGTAEGLAREITETIDAPTIGIGASAACDGQVLVVNDMLGMFDWTPKFVRKYADLRTEIDRAASAFASDVKTRRFPAEVETYFSKKPASQ